MTPLTGSTNQLVALLELAKIAPILTVEKQAQLLIGIGYHIEYSGLARDVIESKGSQDSEQSIAIRHEETGKEYLEVVLFRTWLPEYRLLRGFKNYHTISFACSFDGVVEWFLLDESYEGWVSARSVLHEKTLSELLAFYPDTEGSVGLRILSELLDRMREPFASIEESITQLQKRISELSL